MFSTTGAVKVRINMHFKIFDGVTACNTRFKICIKKEQLGFSEKKISLVFVTSSFINLELHQLQLYFTAD